MSAIPSIDFMDAENTSVFLGDRQADKRKGIKKCTRERLHTEIGVD